MVFHIDSTRKSPLGQWSRYPVALSRAAGEGLAPQQGLHLESRREGGGAAAVWTSRRGCFWGSALLAPAWVRRFSCAGKGREAGSDVKVSVAQSCPTLCDPVDCSPPGSSVRGIFQAGILERVVIPFSRGSSRPGG